MVAREATAGDRRLVAYYTAVAPLPAEELRGQMSRVLPEYMLPAAYVYLERYPLTPSGKLDRKALPAPDADAYAARGYEAPQGETETALAEIWAELLNHDRVGRHDNFFELGGHSLLAVTLVLRMRQKGLHMDVHSLFAASSLTHLARTVSRSAHPLKIPPCLIPENPMAITPEMLPLVELKQEEINRIVNHVPGGASNVQEIYQLVPLQEGILFHHLMGKTAIRTCWRCRAASIPVLPSIVARQQSLNYTPGTEYSYTNTGYNLLAVLVQRVSGQSLAAFTAEHLFVPLGMQRARWRDDSAKVVTPLSVLHAQGREQMFGREDRQ